MTAAPPIYLDLLDDAPTEIESLCMSCHEQGTSRLLLTKIPFFKEVVFMSFTCPHCGYKTSEIQSQAVQEQGVKFTLSVTDTKDVNRQIVKGEGCTITIPELEFEIPAGTKKGSINTIEGFLMQAVEGLAELQPVRRIQDPDVAEKIDQFIEKLEKYARGDTLPFTVIVDDPSGNSFVENPHAPKRDPHLVSSRYFRSLEQNHALGFYPEYDPETGEMKEVKPAHETPSDSSFLQEETLIIPETCEACGYEAEVRMCQMNLPHFRDVIIMSFDCPKCGYKTNEIKAGGPISPLGRRTTVFVDSVEDLNRDILKSDTASVRIPELSLELAEGTLGSRYTTIEGFLDLIHQNLVSNPFVGDSSDIETREKMNKFNSQLLQMKEGTLPFTFVLDDPTGKSHIQNLFYPDPDPKLEIVEYERTWEQNEDLGLNDMKTENYHQDDDENKDEAEKDKKEDKKEEDS
jgi:zinc finger protein